MDNKTDSKDNAFNMETKDDLMKNMPGPNKKFTLKPLIFFALLIVFVIYSTGLVVATYFVTSRINEKNLKSVLTAFNNSNSSLFLNLTGTFNGKIVDIKDGKAWVNTEKGGKIILSIKEPISVSEFSASGVKQIGSTLDKVKLNENATLNVAGYGSGYIITSVTYLTGSLSALDLLQTASISAKTASSSAKTKF